MGTQVMGKGSPNLMGKGTTHKVMGKGMNEGSSGEG